MINQQCVDMGFPWGYTVDGELRATFMFFHGAVHYFETVYKQPGTVVKVIDLRTGMSELTGFIPG